MMPDIRIETFCLGDFQTNCYLVYQEGQTSCWIIDCGDRPQELIARIETLQLQPQQILLTHGHIDHIMGLETVRKHWPQIPISIHEDEVAFLIEPLLNLSGLFGMPIVQPQATGTFAHGDKWTIAGHEFEIRHTPGHSPGNVAFIQHELKIAFVGDTLFAGSIGRSDFPTSNPRHLLQSIREQLLTLPDDTCIYPGHGPTTTIGNERATNPYLHE